jgi:hypothetical protein
MRWKPRDWDVASWIILITGAASVVILSLIVAVYTPVYGQGLSDEDRESLAYQCQEKIWEIWLDGQRIQSATDMDEIDCGVMLDLLEPQTRPFSRLECKWRYVCRQES